MVKTAQSIDANTFAFFTRNPRGSKARQEDLIDAAKAVSLLWAGGFGKIVAHGSYTMNLCTAKKEDRVFASQILCDDLRRMAVLPGNFYNFHPGSHVGQGTDTGISQICDALNQALSSNEPVTVLLETMAGKGSEIGGKFEELKAIMDGVSSDRLGVCLDTCHVYDAGYDIVNDLDGVLADFDRVIGLPKLLALHLNDSMNPVGSHKDRHACIGEGYIGIETFRKIINHPLLQDKPMILETPHDVLGHGKEIALLKSLRI